MDNYKNMTFKELDEIAIYEGIIYNGEIEIYEGTVQWTKRIVYDVEIGELETYYNYEFIKFNYSNFDLENPDKYIADHNQHILWLKTITIEFYRYKKKIDEAI